MCLANLRSGLTSQCSDLRFNIFYSCRYLVYDFVVRLAEVHSSHDEFVDRRPRHKKIFNQAWFTVQAKFDKFIKKYTNLIDFVTIALTLSHRFLTAKIAKLKRYEQSYIISTWELSPQSRTVEFFSRQIISCEVVSQLLVKMRQLTVIDYSSSEITFKIKIYISLDFFKRYIYQNFMKS